MKLAVMRRLGEVLADRQTGSGAFADPLPRGKAVGMRRRRSCAVLHLRPSAFAGYWRPQRAPSSKRGVAQVPGLTSEQPG